MLDFLLNLSHAHTYTHTLNKVKSQAHTQALNLSLTLWCALAHILLLMYHHFANVHTQALSSFHTHTYRHTHRPVLNFWDLWVKSWLDVTGGVQTRQNCGFADGWCEPAAAVRSLSETVATLFILQALPLPTIHPPPCLSPQEFVNQSSIWAIITYQTSASMLQQQLVQLESNWRRCKCLQRVFDN